MEAKAANGPNTERSYGVIDGPTNPMVTPLLTDLYQFTMCYAYWKAGKHNERAVWVHFPFPWLCLVTGKLEEKEKQKQKDVPILLNCFFFSFYCFSFLCSWKRLTWLCYCKLRRILLLIVSLNFLRNQAVAFLFFYFMDFDFIARCLLLAFVLFHKIVCIDCLL